MIINRTELDVKTLVRYAMQAAEEELGPDAGPAFSERLREIYDDLRMRESFLNINSGKGLQAVGEIMKDLGGPAAIVQGKSATQGLHLVAHRDGGPDAA